MFINKANDGRNNICGRKISELRGCLKSRKENLQIDFKLQDLMLTKMQSSAWNLESVSLPISKYWQYQRFSMLPLMIYSI